MFHGYVIERRDGAKAGCGGPKSCADCQFEQEMVDLHAPECQMLTEPPAGWPLLFGDCFSCNCDRVPIPTDNPGVL
jgi:hypothetical protein